MTKISEKQNEIIMAFSKLGTREEKYLYLIEQGCRLPKFDERDKTTENLIELIERRTWLKIEKKDGKVFFSGESESLVLNGLLKLLIDITSGITLQEFLDTEIYFTSAMGLKKFFYNDNVFDMLNLIYDRMQVLAISGIAINPYANSDY